MRVICNAKDVARRTGQHLPHASPWSMKADIAALCRQLHGLLWAARAFSRFPWASSAARAEPEFQY